MTAVTSIEVEIGGRPRELRCSRGARKRIVAALGGKDLRQVLTGPDGEDTLVAVTHALLHDARGNPPADLATIPMLEEALPPGETFELMAAVMAAMLQGKKTKNELEELLSKAATQNGSKIGPSVPSSSESVQ